MTKFIRDSNFTMSAIMNQTPKNNTTFGLLNDNNLFKTLNKKLFDPNSEKLK